jgi:hypothetical protein
MNRTPLAIRGFTVIEMMISTALGSLIVYTAVAGFRTASQTITAANRLSLDNSLMRAGYFEAQLQLDFWTNLDDPTLPANQRPLKQVDSSKGLAFVAMRDITPIATGTGKLNIPRNDWTRPLNAIKPHTMREIRSDGLWDSDAGWDPSYAWSPHDPRTWQRANTAEKERHRDGDWKLRDQDNSLPPFYFGRYAIFAMTKTNPTGSDLFSYSIKPDMNGMTAQETTPVALTYAPGNSEKATHTWYHRQLKAMINCLGYAGFCEYLPPNALYTWYEPFNRNETSEGGIAKLSAAYWSPYNKFNNDDGQQRTSRGIYRQSYSRSFGYFNPRSYDNLTNGSSTSTPSVGTLRDWHYRNFLTNHNASSGTGASELQWFMSHTNFPEPLLAARPEIWPATEASVGRFIKNARHVALARVRQQSTFTGNLIELTWSGLGTSLRGARQQRHQTTGWARWDNRSGATVDPNLDTP